MPALSFQQRFVSRIESGEKTHTIRAKRARLWKVGDDLALFTGMRTKHCRRLFNAPCVMVEGVLIDVGFYDPAQSYKKLHICIEGVVLARDETESFAKRDGFESRYEMWKFWLKNHGEGVFHGDIIHWDYARRYMPQTGKAAA